jgi:hypothetical protein
MKVYYRLITVVSHCEQDQNPASKNTLKLVNIGLAYPVRINICLKIKDESNFAQITQNDALNLIDKMTSPELNTI